MSELVDDIRAFRHFLEAERGMAIEHRPRLWPRPRSIRVWASDGGLRDYLKPTIRELSRYIEHLHSVELAPPSVARHLGRAQNVLPLLADGGAERPVRRRTARVAVAVGADSARAVAGSRRETARPRRTPLDRFYLRDRALLETLYATGGRASEVVGLKREDLHLDRSFCKCVGKGKQAANRAAQPAGRDGADFVSRRAASRRRRRAVGLRQSRRQEAIARNALGARQKIRPAIGAAGQGEPPHVAT